MTNDGDDDGKDAHDEHKILRDTILFSSILFIASPAMRINER